MAIGVLATDTRLLLWRTHIYIRVNIIRFLWFWRVGKQLSLQGLLLSRGSGVRIPPGSPTKKLRSENYGVFSLYKVNNFIY